VHGLFDLDAAIRDERGEGADCRRDGRNHGSDDAGRQRELGDRLSMLLYDHAPDVAFRDEPLELRQHLLARPANLFPDRAFHVLMPPRPVRREATGRCSTGSDPLP
jgi:hypothetical protein